MEAVSKKLEENELATSEITKNRESALGELEQTLLKEKTQLNEQIAALKAELDTNKQLGETLGIEKTTLEEKIKKLTTDNVHINTEKENLATENDKLGKFF